MNERRLKPRWEINQTAELTVENGFNAIPCLVKDISLEGMCISLKRNLFNDVFSNARLVLEEDFEFNLNAHVAWRDQVHERNIYGLSFNGTKESLRSRLAEYIKKNFPDLLVKQWWRGA